MNCLVFLVGLSCILSDESQNILIEAESVCNDVTINSHIIITLQDLFCSFGIDKRDHQRKNISSISARSNVDNWKNTVDGTSTAVGKSVANLYKTLINRIAIIVCGEEAAKLSIKYFLEDQCKLSKKKPISPHDRLVENLITSMEKAKMNSCEFRSTRAIYSVVHSLVRN